MPGNLSNSEKALYNEGKEILWEPVLTLELDVITLFPAHCTKKALAFSSPWQAGNYSEVLIKNLGFHQISIGIFMIVNAKKRLASLSNRLWKKSK